MTLNAFDVQSRAYCDQPQLPRRLPLRISPPTCFWPTLSWVTASSVPALTLPIASWLANCVTSPDAVIVHQRDWLQVATPTPGTAAERATVVLVAVTGLTRASARLGAPNASIPAQAAATV